MTDQKSSAKVWVFRWLNLALWLAFCALTGTGLLLAFRLPPGSRGGRGLQALGMGRHEWGDIHTWLSYLFIGLLVLHVALHWRWLWQIAARRRAWPIAVGIGVGLALMLFLAFQPVNQRSGQEPNPFSKHNSKNTTYERHQNPRHGLCQMQPAHPHRSTGCQRAWHPAPT